MKMRFVFTLVLIFLLSAGCATQGKPKKDNPNIRKYFADLDGDGRKEIIETEDKTATESKYIVTVKENNKMAKVIDTFSLSGKIRDIEFAEFNLDGQEWMAIYFDQMDNSSGIAIYKLTNNKFTKVFFAVSVYGIEASLDPMAPRIKVGKPPREKSSPNLVPDWDVWLWTGDKFIRN
jgi:hypothetical protein